MHYNVIISMESTSVSDIELPQYIGEALSLEISPNHDSDGNNVLMHKVTLNIVYNVIARRVNSKPIIYAY